MDDGTPYCPRPKHLPRLIPKLDESNCPTATEIAQIESVKPCDGEGILIRRKWKEKIWSEKKAEAGSKSAIAFKTPIPPLLPKRNIKPSEKRKANGAKMEREEFFQKLFVVGKDFRLETRLVRKIICKDCKILQTNRNDQRG